MLGREPRRAESALGAAGRQHVERCHDLRQVGDIAICDARDEGAETDPLGRRGEVAEGRVRVEHRFPVPTDLRDLQHVIHHPDRVEAGVLRPPGDVGQPRPDL